MERRKCKPRESYWPDAIIATWRRCATKSGSQGN
jgi:hypothetical protein